MQLQNGFHLVVFRVSAFFCFLGFAISEWQDEKNHETPKKDQDRGSVLKTTKHMAAHAVTQLPMHGGLFIPLLCCSLLSSWIEPCKPKLDTGIVANSGKRTCLYGPLFLGWQLTRSRNRLVIEHLPMKEKTFVRPASFASLASFAIAEATMRKRILSGLFISNAFCWGPKNQENCCQRKCEP